jgi:hypothetical protein
VDVRVLPDQRRGECLTRLVMYTRAGPADLALKAIAQQVANKPDTYIAETGWPTASMNASLANDGAGSPQGDASVANLQSEQISPAAPRPAPPAALRSGMLYTTELYLCGFKLTRLSLPQHIRVPGERQWDKVLLLRGVRRAMEGVGRFVP